MPEMYLRQPGFTYSTCGQFTKNKERIKKIKETGDSRYIYQNELDKACFQHDMAYKDFKNLNGRTAADKALRDKAFCIAKYPKYDGYQGGLASMVYKFLGRKISGSGIKNENISNKKLAEALHKPVIKKISKRKVRSPFIDNILGANLADVQLISKFSKGFRFLLCVIDIYSKYAWVIPLKDEKNYNRSMKSWLEKNDIEMYSTHNEGNLLLLKDSLEP